MKRKEAIEYFNKCNLSYKDITLADLDLLKWILNRNFATVMINRMAGRSYGYYWHSVNEAKYYKGTYDIDNKLKCAYITAKGNHFTARDVISFNQNGEITFCFEADNNNLQPVLEAFIEWSNILKTNKYGGLKDENI